MEWLWRGVGFDILVGRGWSVYSERASNGMRVFFDSVFGVCVRVKRACECEMCESGSDSVFCGWRGGKVSAEMGVGGSTCLYVIF
jgi:hypothetical protein